MKIVPQSYEILYPTSRLEIVNQCRVIEQAGRTCYKSEDKITPDSYKKFCKMLKERNHDAMLEHSHLTVKFITDRGVSHEFVRHRICSYAQESTRYCNYSKDKFNNEITVISPFEKDAPQSIFIEWETAMMECEKRYNNLITSGISPQIARSVLPTALKTELICSTNFREWNNIFSLRVKNAGAHPQIRSLLLPLWEYLHEIIPEVIA